MAKNPIEDKELLVQSTLRWVISRKGYGWRKPLLAGSFVFYKKMNRYTRPYCEYCKVLYGKQSIGLILKCTRCDHPLILKSFNPWPKIIGGIAITLLALISLSYSQIPIIWIGGFIAGPSLIINGFIQWGKVRELDKERYF